MIPEILLIGVIGGLVTGVSPCILPVLPIVLAVSADAKRKPLLVALGIAISFTAITLLGTVALSALGLPSATLRWVGVALLVIVGLSMLFPTLGHLLEKPFAAIQVPSWISSKTRGSAGKGSGFGIGLALGAVYAPCAGPVLAAVTVAGATGDIGWPTVILAFSFAFGACVPLFFFALAGSAWSKRAQFATDNRARISRVAGALVLALALAIATDVPAKLQRTLPDWTASIQQKFNSSEDTQSVLNGLRGDSSEDGAQAASASLNACRDEDPSRLLDCGDVPAFEGLTNWINTTPAGSTIDPAHPEKRDGRQTITLVDFWAYACINCQRANEHVTKLYDRYRDYGLNVVGVHAPEYAFEHDAANVAMATNEQGIHYPVAQDNGFLTWNNFSNRYWPAHYLVDAHGRVRQIHEGEGAYAATERLVRQLLADANPGIELPAPIEANTDDAPIATMGRNLETYLGTDRASLFSNPRSEYRAGVHDFAFVEPAEKGYSLEGPWELRGQSIAPAGPGAKIHLNYHAALVQIVASGKGELTVTGSDGKVTKFPASEVPGTIDLVKTDGKPASGNLTIEVPESVSAYSLTFG